MSAGTSTLYQQVRTKIENHPLGVAALLIAAIVGGVAILVGNVNRTVDALRQPDLLITSLTVEGAVTPFENRPVRADPAGAGVIYTDGVNVTLSLTHNGAGREDVALTGTAIEVSYTPGRRSELAYTVPDTGVRPLGPLEALRFEVDASEERSAVDWISADRTRVATKATNILLPPDREPLFRSVKPGGVDALHFTLDAHGTVLYAFRFVLTYNIGRNVHRRMTETIKIYSEE